MPAYLANRGIRHYQPPLAVPHHAAPHQVLRQSKVEPVCENAKPVTGIRLSQRAQGGRSAPGYQCETDMHFLFSRFPTESHFTIGAGFNNKNRLK